MSLRKMTGAACAIGLLAAMLGPSPLQHAFTYQGVLLKNGAPYTGTADMTFYPYDDPVAGSVVAGQVDKIGVQVVDGLFTVELDFGTGLIEDDQIWFAIRARTPSGVGAFESVLPRQPLRGSPYSIQTRGIFVDGSGKVGIGTTVPAARLHIDASSNSDIGLRVDGPGASTGNVTIGSPGGSPGFSANANNGNRRDIRFSDEGISIITSSTPSIPSSLNGIFIGENGRVGIGTTAPTAALTLHSSSKLSFDEIADHRAIYSPLGAGSPLVLSNHAFAANPTIRFRDANSNEDVMIVDVNQQRVGISDSTLDAKLNIESIDIEAIEAVSTGFIGIRGKSSKASGSATGVFGEADSSGGAGVAGQTVAGTGVRGAAIGVSGVNYGVTGFAAGDFGRGVYGYASNATVTGVPIGVYAVCESSNGYDFYADGAGVDYGGTSSIRWKRNVTPIPDPLDKIDQIRGVYFDWDEDHGGQHDVGMIAEEVGAVLPEIVRYEANGVDAMGMDYGKTTPLLVEAVKAVNGRADALQAENELLRRETENLRARLDAMETLVERLAAGARSQ